MAEWTFTPLQDGFSIEQAAPPTLITRYEDGTEHRREKNSNFPRRWKEKFSFTDAEIETALDFFEARGLRVTFTKLSFFPNEVAGHEETVRFTGAFEIEKIAPGEWEVEIEFEKVF